MVTLSRFVAPSVSPTPNASPLQISVIRDGEVPEIGSQDSSKQYDSYVGDGGGHGTQSIGYLFAQPFVVSKITYTEGKHFWDGGWWVVGPVVEADVNGVWTPVTNQRWNPNQPSEGGEDWVQNSESSFETFTVLFDPVETRGIRLTGNAGGQDHFISVGELRVTTLFGPGCTTPRCALPPAPSARFACLTAFCTQGADASLVTAGGWSSRCLHPDRHRWGSV